MHSSNLCMCVQKAKCEHKVHNSSDRTNPGLCVLHATILATEIKTSGFHPLLSPSLSLHSSPHSPSWILIGPSALSTKS